MPLHTKRIDVMFFICPWELFWRSLKPKHKSKRFVCVLYTHILVLCHENLLLFAPQAQDLDRICTRIFWSQKRWPDSWFMCFVLWSFCLGKGGNILSLLTASLYAAIRKANFENTSQSKDHSPTTTTNPKDIPISSCNIMFFSSYNSLTRFDVEIAPRLPYYALC